MKRAVHCAALVLMMFPAAGSTQDFDAGFAAYEAGDFATALREWTALGKSGNMHAQFNLAHMFENGLGVQQNDAAAATWYRLAAEQGDMRAQANLGVSYAEGRGVAQDHAEATKWFRLAAEQGDSIAQFNLGIQYFYGDGVPEDYVTAYMWASLAVANGHVAARDLRENIISGLSPANLSEAERRAKACMASGYQGCD